MSYFKILIIMSLMAIVPSSSFSFYDYFDRLTLNQEPDITLQTFALKQNHSKAHFFNFANSDEGSVSWLNSGVRLARNDPMISTDIGSWHLAQGHFTQAERYLMQGHLQGIDEATGKLLALWQENEEHSKINELDVGVIANWDLDIAAAKVNGLMATGEQAKLTLLAAKFRAQTHLLPLYYELVEFKVISQAEPLPRFNADLDPSKCPLSITLLANQLGDLRRWQQLAKEYQKSNLNQFLCIADVRYVKPFTDACELETKTPIRCNEARLASELTSLAHVPSDYIALMLPKGGANVHMGILYLDRADDGKIFTHEVAHLLGFVDEYKLKQTHPVCQSTNSELSWNIATVSTNTVSEGYVSLQQLEKLPWYTQIAPTISANQANQAKQTNLTKIPVNQALTPEGVGVFVADTCMESKSVTALKPLQRNTMMNNHDYPLPPLYVHLLGQNLSRFKMPSYHYNFGVAMYRAKKGKEALSWLNKARH
ncbi:hypothetical protein [Thalassotalea euphylliae]|nr:hypothetical protein [Thalassotalea euphylliae]